MFERSKVNKARSAVIEELVGARLVTVEMGSSMQDIAGNPSNTEYGMVLLRAKVAKSSFAAAAAIFARISVYHQGNSKYGLTSRTWKRAAHRAMLLGGASDDEASFIVDDLIAMNRREFDADPLFRTTPRSQEPLNPPVAAPSKPPVSRKSLTKRELDEAAKAMLAREQELSPSPTQPNLLEASSDEKVAMIARSLEDFASAWFTAIAAESRALGRSGPPDMEDAFYAMFFGAADSLSQAVAGSSKDSLSGIQRYMILNDFSPEEFARLVRCQADPALLDWVIKGGNVVHRSLVEKVAPAVALQPIAAQYCRLFG